jgi:hypothetical protein
MAVPARNTRPNITSARNHDERITDVGESLFSLLFLPSRRPVGESEDGRMKKGRGPDGESAVHGGPETGGPVLFRARGAGPEKRRRVRTRGVRAEEPRRERATPPTASAEAAGC